ncbi:SPFH domain-containing protein [Croceicoccus sp. Ery5]|uniref:SPFH domain-containing protein n=1 Tax=Croceicoccus sp. Ery5 TaxID=1703340 RepID=UPI001E3BEC9C|nr:SPFH domain-containing protein [Croceicoccus sp. Ery5]
MAHIRNFGLFAQLKSEVSNHVIRFSSGRVKQSGRGLVFWFALQSASIVEIPMDDREMTLFLRGRSQDFQAVSVQGSIGWHVVDSQRLAERIDFSIDLTTGKPQREPVEAIEARITGIANQALLQVLSEASVQALLDAGPGPLRHTLEEALSDNDSLAEIGIAVVSVRLANLAPSSELERALQTPTFEALQEKADQAMFQRRAFAVEKERAIAENELATKIELARRQKDLIAEEANNALAKAKAEAETSSVEASAEADSIGKLLMAKTEAEAARVAIYRDLPPAMLIGLASQKLAETLETVEHFNVSPDLLAAAIAEFRKPSPRLTR